MITTDPETCRAILIRPNMDTEEINLPVNDWVNDAARRMDGAYIEVKRLTDTVCLLADADGIARDLPFNLIATSIMKILMDKAGMPTDERLFGTIIFIGAFDGQNPTDVPRDWMTTEEL